MKDDDRRLPDEHDPAELPEAVEVPASDEDLDDTAVTRRAPKVGDEIELPTITPSKSWRGGPGIGRFAAIGCALGVIALLALLVGGVSMAKRTAWMAVERSRQRILDGLPAQLDSGERLRIDRNLNRFRTQLRQESDPYPLMGQFMERARAALEDGSLDVDEVRALNEFLESVLPGGSGLPPRGS